MDITNDMHVVDSNHENNVAIGSITTGVSFCLVSILIICLSHLDEPYSEEVADTSEKSAVVDQEAVQSTNDETVTYKQPTVVPGYEEIPYNFGRSTRRFDGPLQAKPEWFHWFKDEIAFSNVAKIRPLTVTTDSYRKFQEIYRNIHVSYLMLLLFPMVSLLALVRTQIQIVDVHVQLIFFSTIFFAVLDIMQSRVSSVLASFKQENSLSNAIGTIKIFVVLAFTLAKLFNKLLGHRTPHSWLPRSRPVAFEQALHAIA
jgi:hypothetical protein